jgi:hypothetical protein
VGEDLGNRKEGKKSQVEKSLSLKPPHPTQSLLLDESPPINENTFAESKS